MRWSFASSGLEGGSRRASGSGCPATPAAADRLLSMTSETLNCNPEHPAATSPCTSATGAGPADRRKGIGRRYTGERVLSGWDRTADRASSPPPRRQNLLEVIWQQTWSAASSGAETWSSGMAVTSSWSWRARPMRRLSPAVSGALAGRPGLPFRLARRPAGDLTWRPLSPAPTARCTARREKLRRSACRIRPWCPVAMGCTPTGCWGRRCRCRGPLGRPTPPATNRWHNAWPVGSEPTTPGTCRAC